MYVENFYCFPTSMMKEVMQGSSSSLERCQSTRVYGRAMSWCSSCKPRRHRILNLTKISGNKMSFPSTPILQSATPPTCSLMASPLFWEHSVLIYAPTTKRAHHKEVKKKGHHFERNPLRQQLSCRMMGQAHKPCTQEAEAEDREFRASLNYKAKSSKAGVRVKKKKLQ